MGEAIAGVVGGVSEHHHLSWLVGARAALGTLITISLWWVCFDFVSHHLPRPGTVMVSARFYLHLPLTMEVAAVGATVLDLVEHAREHVPAEVRWLLVCAVAVVLVSIALLMRTTQVAAEHEHIYRVGGRLAFLASIIILLSGFSSLGTIPLLVLLVFRMLAPVFQGFKARIEMLGAGGIAPT